MHGNNLQSNWFGTQITTILWTILNTWRWLWIFTLLPVFWLLSWIISKLETKMMVDASWEHTGAWDFCAFLRLFLSATSLYGRGTKWHMSLTAWTGGRPRKRVGMETQVSFVLRQFGLCGLIRGYLRYCFHSLHFVLDFWWWCLFYHVGR